MNGLQEDRKIDISRARPKESERSHGKATERQPQADAARKTNAALPQRPAQPSPAPAAEPQRPKAPPQNRRRRTRRMATAALCALLVLVAFAGGAYLYLDSLIQESDLGSVDDAAPPAAESGPAEQQTIVPPDFAGVRNILVLGLDYDNEGSEVRDKKHPNTDMILYVRIDGTAHTLKMLQFPRDIFVEQAGGASGKINGILAVNVDEGNGLGALKTYLETNFGLPIDDYITIDIEALRDMVDAFDGVTVYVPQDMRYYNSRTGALEGELLQGWRKLKGAECEYFLRYRQGLVRGDLDRLVMQRQFYAGLFRRLKTASVGDIVKLLPVAQQYIRTDIPTLELASIAIELSGMENANISIGRIPVYGTDQRYYGGVREGTQPVVTAKEETAALLNEHFRPADDPITAADIGTPDWPTSGGAAGAEMSTMGDVENESGETPPEA